MNVFRIGEAARVAAVRAAAIASISWAAAMVMTAAPAHAWPVNDATLEAAISEFVAAQDGDAKAQEKNAQTFDKLLAQPERARDPMALVFGGAATARLANATIWPWKKLSHAEDGLARIDKALALLQPAQENAAAPGQSSIAKTVRYVAASVMIEMPGFFNRDAQTRKLIAGLSQNLDTDPQTNPAFKAATYTLMGQLAQKDSKTADARKFYEKAVAYNVKPESDDARKALQALSK